LLTTVDITNSQQAGICTENASDQKRTSVGLEELNSDCTDKSMYLIMYIREQRYT
jgi:hypothetical protein